MSDTKYEAMRDAGASTNQVYLKAMADGLREIECIAMLRRVFDLSLLDAKEVTIVASGVASSLDEHQQRLIEDLAKLLEFDDEFLEDDESEKPHP
jgi:hypothetical protein